ncbi:MAG: hypothetical protein HY319_28260 [Armatimonadetes bacterium]|nr:hypothetical protein [Armatimonadota bacterium]
MKDAELRAHFQQLAAATAAAMEALMPETGGKRRRTFRARRIQTRLMQQREVLERLHAGEVAPDEALVLLLDEETPAAALESEALSGYFSRLSGDIRQIGAARRRQRKKAPERDEGPGGPD